MLCRHCVLFAAIGEPNSLYIELTQGPSGGSTYFADRVEMSGFLQYPDGITQVDLPELFLFLDRPNSSSTYVVVTCNFHLYNRLCSIYLAMVRQHIPGHLEYYRRI